MLEVDIVNTSGNKLPFYATEGSAGMDLMANITEPIELSSLERRLIPTGIKIALPIGYEAQVRPRSGLALKQGISVINTPGTIDSDYRGEIGIVLVNLSNEKVVINPNDRIAQLVVSKYETVKWKLKNELDETKRNSGGYGSTGV